MKQWIAFFLTIVSSASFAATVSIQNLNPAENNAYVVTDSAGIAVAGSNYKGALGYFTVSDAAVTTGFANGDTAALSSGFAQFGNTFALDNITSGAFQTSASSSTEAPSPFGGSNIYVVLFEGTSLATATELLIAKLNATFAVDLVIPATQSVTLTPSGVTTLLAGNVGPSGDFFGAGALPTYALGNVVAAVPEPSRVLFLAFGAVGLLMRRRRA